MPCAPHCPRIGAAESLREAAQTTFNAALAALSQWRGIGHGCDPGRDSTSAGPECFQRRLQWCPGRRRVARTGPRGPWAQPRNETDAACVSALRPDAELRSFEQLRPLWRRPWAADAAVPRCAPCRCTRMHSDLPDRKCLSAGLIEQFRARRSRRHCPGRPWHSRTTG